MNDFDDEVRDAEVAVTEAEERLGKAKKRLQDAILVRDNPRAKALHYLSAEAERMGVLVGYVPGEIVLASSLIGGHPMCVISIMPKRSSAVLDPGLPTSSEVSCRQEMFQARRAQGFRDPTWEYLA